MLIVAYTLITLYSIPVLVLLGSFLLSDGFQQGSFALDFSVALAGIYFTATRDALGTFVVPFVTAFSAGQISGEEGKYSKKTMALFFVLVALFLLSMLCYAVINMRWESFLAQLNEANSAVLKNAKEQLLGVSAAYVKESLAYISLLLGVTQATRAASRG